MTVPINEDGPEITMEASTDLSDLQFHVVTLNTSGQVKKADDADDPVECMLGVLQNKPAAQYREAVVRVGGVTKAMGGDTVAPGIAITCNSDGHCVAAVANDWVLGYTLEAMVSGSISRILLKSGGGYVAPT